MLNKLLQTADKGWYCSLGLGMELYTTSCNNYYLTRIVVWRKLHSEEFLNLYSSPNITKVIKKEVLLGGTFDTCGGNK
jgi:hypothetical protein